MRALLLVGAVLLAMTACDDDDSSISAATPSASAPSSPAPAPATPLPRPLSYHVVASQPVPLTTQGIALFGDKVAYVEGDQRLVWMSWRTGDRSTVYRSTYGSLYLLDNSGRYRYLVDEMPSPAGDDPSSPRRYLALDLSTGRVAETDYPTHARIVGELNDARIEIERALRPDGRESWRSDLVLVDQQPDPDVPRRPLTSSGLVVQAAYDRKHRVVWTERARNMIADPQRLWTVDIFQPEEAPQLLLDDPDVVPYDPVIGRGYVGWTEYGEHLVLMPLAGGPVTRVPGHVAVANGPSAYGRIVAVVLTRRGESRLEVLRVDP